MVDEHREKRRFPRVPSENVVLMRKLGEDAGEALVKTKVMGLGGCLLVSQEAMKPGTTVELLISVSGRVVKTQARVAWENMRPEGGFDVGVEFLAVEPADRHILEVLLAEKTPDTHKA
jgi:hypothetical protein